MIIIGNKKELLNNLRKQIDAHFSINETEENTLKKYVDVALKKCEYCFSHVENKYFRCETGEVRFNPFHSVQYMTFLYYLSNIIYRNSNDTVLCDKLYYLNKTMNGLDMFYAIELPDVFSAEHPVATVLGRAKYANGFFFYQGCTVGGNRDKDGNVFYPILGENVRMYANSSIIGKCIVGNNVVLGAGTLVKNQDIPDNAIVFGQSPNLTIKLKK